MSIDLGLISGPHPDVAVVTGSPRDFLVDQPKVALLEIEVSESTVEANTHAKASLYAACGIADNWVIDFLRNQMPMFRNPRHEAMATFGAVYGHDRDTRIASPNARLPVRDLQP